MRGSISGLGTRFPGGKFIFWTIAFLIPPLFFYMFSGVCFPFAVGFVLAYLCAPFVNSLSKFVNRTLISAILAVGSVCIFIAAGVELIPRLKEYLTFIAHNAPAYYDRFISFLDNTFSFVNVVEYKTEISSLKLEIQKYLDQKIYIFASILGQIASKREMIANFLSFFVIMPISFFYFLRDWKGITSYVYGCVPNRQKNAMLEASGVVRRTFANFFRGQFYVVAILSIYYTTSLLGVGLKHYVYLGILSGLFSFIPFIGALFSCALVVFISAPVITLTKLYIILTIYMIGQLVEGYALYPRFVGKRTGLHPLWILFSFFAGMQLGGIVGVLIAIPLIAVARNLIKLAMQKFKASQAYKQ